MTKRKQKQARISFIVDKKIKQYRVGKESRDTTLRRLFGIYPQQDAILKINGEKQKQ